MTLKQKFGAVILCSILAFSSDVNALDIDVPADPADGKAPEKGLMNIIVPNPEMSLLLFSKTNDFSKVECSPVYFHLDDDLNEHLSALMMRIADGGREAFKVYYENGFYSYGSEQQCVHEIPSQCTDLYVKGWAIDLGEVKQCNAVKRLKAEDFLLTSESQLAALNAKFPSLESIEIDVDWPSMENGCYQDFKSSVVDLGLFVQFKNLRSLCFRGCFPVANIEKLSARESLANLEISVITSSDNFREEKRSGCTWVDFKCKRSDTHSVNVRDIVASIPNCYLYMEFVGVVPVGIEKLDEIQTPWDISLDYRKIHVRQTR